MVCNEYVYRIRLSVAICPNSAFKNAGMGGYTPMKTMAVIIHPCTNLRCKCFNGGYKVGRIKGSIDTLTPVDAYASMNWVFIGVDNGLSH